MRSLFRELVSRNEVRSGVVRLAVSRGQDRPTTVLTAQPRKFSDRPVALKAIVSSVCVHTQLAQLKTANRLPYILAKQQAEAAGADEALLLNEAGRVAEFSASNIFVVGEGKLFTPAVKDGVLPGVTRAMVIELAKHLKIPVKEKSLLPEILDTAEEVFATNSLIEIAPVATWSRKTDITTRLQAAYRTLVASEPQIHADSH
ncbi:MAG: aminotransferase class IV [Verrucomicrobiota bacterium]